MAQVLHNLLRGNSSCRFRNRQKEIAMTWEPISGQPGEDADLEANKFDTTIEANTRYSGTQGNYILAQNVPVVVTHGGTTINTVAVGASWQDNFSAIHLEKGAVPVTLDPVTGKSLVIGKSRFKHLLVR